MFAMKATTERHKVHFYGDSLTIGCWRIYKKDVIDVMPMLRDGSLKKPDGVRSADLYYAQNGQCVSVKIHGVRVIGRIRREHCMVYICQDMFRGANCDDKLGFLYSWTVGGGDKFAMRDHKVSDVRLCDEQRLEDACLPTVHSIRDGKISIWAVPGFLIANGLYAISNAEVRRIARKLKIRTK